MKNKTERNRFRSLKIQWPSLVKIGKAITYKKDLLSRELFFTLIVCDVEF